MPGTTARTSFLRKRATNVAAAWRLVAHQTHRWRHPNHHFDFVECFVWTSALHLAGNQRQQQHRDKLWRDIPRQRPLYCCSTPRRSGRDDGRRRECSGNGVWNWHNLFVERRPRTGDYSGTATSNLTLTGAQAGDAGTVNVTISGSSGQPALTSSNAIVYFDTVPSTVAQSPAAKYVSKWELIWLWLIRLRADRVFSICIIS